MRVFCGVVMLCNSVVSTISNVTGLTAVKWKKNYSGWREKQEENKGGLDCSAPNEYRLQKKKKKRNYIILKFVAQCYLMGLFYKDDSNPSFTLVATILLYMYTSKYRVEKCHLITKKKKVHIQFLNSLLLSLTN